MDNDISEILFDAVQLACQPQNAHRILAGREQVLALSKTLVLSQLSSVAKRALNLDDDWEYRRLLELLELVDSSLLQEFVEIGLTSQDPDILEAAGDYAKIISGE